MEKAFIGLDIGTQGVRGVAITPDGRVLNSCKKGFDSMNVSKEPGRQEQNPEDWWRTAMAVLAVLSDTQAEICAAAIDGTSGTLIPLDEQNRPMMNAMMYNDTRSAKQAERIEEEANRQQAAFGFRFNSSYTLPKILWCMENGIQAKRFVHQTDYIVGKLTGIYGRTDTSNALKAGYDLTNSRWPEFVTRLLPKEKLPEVLPCGYLLGEVSAAGAEATGMKKGTPICAGATDGYASSLAACAARPGDWASILGTTLIVKGVTENLIGDPGGVIYSHRHPQGWWMPGGASNVGGRCINEWFGRERLDELNQKSSRIAPTGNLVYPLTARGERFPFVQADFEGFSLMRMGREEESVRYLSVLEGVGYVERMCYDSIETMGVLVPDTIYTTGGGCQSKVWLHTRAAILNRTLKIPFFTDAAAGSAMLAASTVYFKELSKAVECMGRIREVIEPDPVKAEIYNEYYQEFVCEVKKKRQVEHEYI